MIYMHQVGASLASHRHDVHCVMGSHQKNTDFITSRGMKVLKYQTPEGDVTWTSPDFQDLAKSAGNINHFVSTVGKQMAFFSFQVRCLTAQLSPSSF